MSDNFFKEQSEQSQVKAAIVTKYFWAWAKVITSKQQRTNRIGYIDLFSGPGRYRSGEPSTPLLILRQAIDDPVYRDRLVTTFNDADPANAATLEAFLRHHHAQGLSARLLTPAELFHPATHETVKV